MMNDIDSRQGRSKTCGRRGWLCWLCNPRVLKLLIKVGLVIFWIIRSLSELVKLLKNWAASPDMLLRIPAVF